MKSLTLFSVLATMSIPFQSGVLGEKVFTHRIEQKVVVEKVKVKPIEPLVNALIQVESRGNSQAIGDTHLGEPSIGVLQIRPIMVREVTIILKLKRIDHKYKLSDRKDSIKSTEMFYIWYEFHHKDDDFETIARSWNGGSNGPKLKATEHYWNKVKVELES